jgi:hypothetical protein
VPTIGYGARGCDDVRQSSVIWRQVAMLYVYAVGCIYN